MGDAIRTYSDDLLPIAGRALNRWSDILGQSIRWTNNYLDKTGEYIASLHVFEHMDIYRSELILGELSGKDSFNIDWNALCDLSFDEDYGNSLELFIQTEVKLEGIEVPFQFQDEKESLAFPSVFGFAISGGISFPRVPQKEIGEFSVESFREISTVYFSRPNDRTASELLFSENSTKTLPRPGTVTIHKLSPGQNSYTLS